MARLVKTFALITALLAAPVALAASGGVWTKLPSAPASVLPSTSVWTGKELVVVGHRPFNSVAVAEAYNPTAQSWRMLTPPPRLGSDPYCCSAVWTGKQVLVWGAFTGAAYTPATNTWRTLARSVQGGVLAWTGREAIGWGGGCCGDARSNGRAYNPATGRTRALPRSPLAPDQHPIGAWTGRELILFVSGLTPDGKPFGASYARGAAYNPATNSWRALAPMPVRGGNAAWTGHQLLVVGAGQNARLALGFNVVTNRWRRLASLPASAPAAATVWTGKRLLVWFGSRGLSYDPSTNRWSRLPKWPLRERGGSTVAWTGHSLIVWGGEIGTPLGTSIPPKFPLDGAAFTPEVN
jgi:hypothetical protein